MTKTDLRKQIFSGAGVPPAVGVSGEADGDAYTTLDAYSPIR